MLQLQVFRIRVLIHGRGALICILQVYFTYKLFDLGYVLSLGQMG